MRSFWAGLFAIVLAAAFILTAVAPMINGWWIPPGVSSYSHEIDWLFYGILIVTALFFVLTEAILVYNMFRWAAEPGRKAQFTHGNHKLEMVWTVVPGVILILLAVIQINVWADIKYPSHMTAEIEKNPKNFLQMEVTTRQWDYRIRYASPERMAGWQSDEKSAVEDFKRRLPERRDDVFDVNDIHTWKGQKTLVFLRTRDIGHSFFIPVFRVKQDSMPGRTIPLWFEATESNTKREGNVWKGGFKPDGTADKDHDWDLVCTQFCGSRHSMMRGKVFVHPTKEDYLEWLKARQKEYLPPKDGQ